MESLYSVNGAKEMESLSSVNELNRDEYAQNSKRYNVLIKDLVGKMTVKHSGRPSLAASMNSFVPEQLQTHLNKGSSHGLHDMMG